MNQQHTVVLTKGWHKTGRSPSQKLAIIEAPSTPFEARRYYTPIRVAETLAVSRETVYDWIRKGKLKAQPLPGVLRLLGENINQFLLNQHCK